jgi:hypothetical protein
MDERFFRGPEHAREARFLPAETYNLTRLLLARSRVGHVFVPIRSMQYLAVLDAQEILFVDSEQKSLVAIAWDNFRPGNRETLEERVAYEAVYYASDWREIMQRLQGEFAKALQALAGRESVPPTGSVVDFPKREK